MENTHNFGGGSVQPLGQLTAVAALCREHGMGFHLDGARLWNAHVATGVALATYGRLFDTVSVCFSKGLGAPVGSMLLSSTDGSRWRPGLAQATGRRDAAGRHPGGRRAGTRSTTTSPGWPTITPPPGPSPRRWPSGRRRPSTWPRWRPTSWCSTPGRRPPAVAWPPRPQQGVRVSALGPRMIRAVTHLDVTRAQCLTAGVALGELLRD